MIYCKKYFAGREMYYIYILRCEGGSLYTGITTDLERRFRQHAGERSGGAKYTALRPPLRFEAVFTADGRSAASKLEYRIKALCRSEKEQLILGAAPEGLELGSCRRADLKILFGG